MAVKKLPGMAAARESLTEASFLSLMDTELALFPVCSAAAASLSRPSRSAPTRTRPSRDLLLLWGSVLLELDTEYGEGHSITVREANAGLTVVAPL